MNYYRVHPAEDHDHVDLSLYYLPVRWSNDGSEFIAGFKTPPLDSSEILNLQQARDLMKQVQWCADSSQFGLTE